MLCSECVGGLKMTKFNEQFIGQYSLSKTLRFELKPIGKTAEMIKANGFLEHDTKRADNYVLVKRFLDDYYRYYIEETLKGKELDKDLVEKAYSAYIGNNADECEKINKELRERVSKIFVDKDKYGLEKYKELFSVKQNRKTNRTEGILLSWVRNNDKYSQADKEKYEELIVYFNKFTTYFKGFKQNRDNMFSAEAEVTAIANRIVNENMYRFFDNVKNFENIKEHYPDLYKEFVQVEQYFVPSAFGKILSQSAIDNYNQGVIGRFENDLDAEGVNQVINEYRQNCLKDGKEVKKLPTMITLYKQILSEDKSENILEKENIDTDEKAINLVKESYKILTENVKEIKKLIDYSITEETLDTIYIKKIEISTVSNAIFGNREIIKDALNYKKEKYKEVVCVKTISDAIKEYKQVYDGEIFDWKDKNIDDLFVKYFSSFYTGYVTKSKNTKKQKDEIVNIIEYVDNIKKELDTIVSNDVRDYKNILDKMNAIVRFYKMFYLYDGMKKLDIRGKNEYFYNHFELMYFDIREINKKYNEIRNYATKITQPNNGEKLKFTFDASTLLDGWDKNKEKDNLSILLVKNGKYYLGVMDNENKKCFDFENEDVAKKAGQVGETYQKMEYKQISFNYGGLGGFVRKCFNTAQQFRWTCPKDCLNEEGKIIITDEEARNNLVKIIDCYKDFLNKYEKNGFKYKDFSFQMLPSDQYSKLSEFTQDIERQRYKLWFRNVSAKYIDELVEQGKLYLFQIYNKDFSDNKKQKGTDNLHTLYWKALFSPENMNKTDGAIIKLNGEAEIFYRFKADGIPVIHKKGSILLNKISKYGETIPSKIYKRIFDCLNGRIEKQDLNEEERKWYDKAVWKEAKYDIVKDKRYYGDDGKYFFHCPITINFRCKEKVNGNTFNQEINQFVANNPDIHIIGIDRGERHLLYYTVIDQQGNIIEQDSLNNISSDYVANNKLVPHKVNYHDLLDKREQERADARLAWTAIENIKEIKSGYLSQVVHKLALLVEKYNAVIVLENLNVGFKRGRFKVEKQVYQNFEKALIQKFNYLVFKNRSYAENGSFANGYQLTAPFTSFKDIYRQTGILYYVDPSYTSHICPKTGFVNYINSYLKYTNVEIAKLTLAKFDGFKFNNAKGYFEFVIDYDKFINGKIPLGKWTICTVGQERYSYDAKNQTTIKYDVTKELQNLLVKYNVAYEDGKDLLGKIKDIDEKGFYSALLYWLRLTMQLRYTVKGTENEDDYILSPVADKNGNFFDSRKAQDNEPKNADANGAYHIALKGLQLIQNIDDGKLAKPEKNMENAKWFKFARERNS